MSTILQEPESSPTPLPKEWSIADLQHFLGDVPTERIRLFPSPGTATEADLLAAMDHEDRICELIDGVLVEKDMASYESYLTAYLMYLIQAYIVSHPVGVVLGPDGPLRLSSTRIRIPDVSVIRWERLPGRCLPTDAVFEVVPDLAIEVLSKGNTRSEMSLKCRDYLDAGVQLVWYIHPRKRTATVYSSDGTVQEYDDRGILNGATVLPGFELLLQPFFDHVPVDRT